MYRGPSAAPAARPTSLARASPWGLGMRAALSRPHESHALQDFFSPHVREGAARTSAATREESGCMYGKRRTQGQIE